MRRTRPLVDTVRSQAYIRPDIMACMDVGRTIREARRRSGLTQAELAARAGTSQAAVSAYEGASKTPSVTTLERLLAAAGVRLTTASAPAPLVPSAARHAATARRLLDVLALAEALPTRHARELSFPRLPAATATE